MATVALATGFMWSLRHHQPIICSKVHLRGHPPVAHASHVRLLAAPPAALYLSPLTHQALRATLG